MASSEREKPCAGAVSGWGLRALEAIGIGLDVPYVAMRGLRVLDGERVGASVWRESSARCASAATRTPRSSATVH